MLALVLSSEGSSMKNKVVKIFERFKKRFKELFQSPSIPPAVNRKERRVRQSIARRQRSLARIDQDNQK